MPRPTVAASLLVMAALTCSIARAQDNTSPDLSVGEAPSWARYRQLAEMNIAARLVDPESARFTWTAGFTRGEYKPFLQGKVRGYIACGYVNAKNRMGGYTGATSFVTVVAQDRIVYAELDRRAGGMIAEQCAKSARAGYFPPLAIDTAAARFGGDASTAVATTAGLTLRAMPEGAYITAVVPDSPAASAGLAPGMVIARVNAIPLAGMGEAMLKVIDAAGANAALELVGGRAMTLRAQP